jgi:hypothetical protein
MEVICQYVCKKYVINMSKLISNKIDITSWILKIVLDGISLVISENFALFHKFIRKFIGCIWWIE